MPGGGPLGTLLAAAPGAPRHTALPARLWRPPVTGNGRAKGSPPPPGDSQPVPGAGESPLVAGKPAPAAVIAGGWAENRPQALWKPEDGLAPTAMNSRGKPLGYRQCCAWLKGRRRRCTRPNVTGRRVCRMHGGAPGTGRPPIHGGYAKSLGTQLRALFDGHMANPDSSDPTGELALMRASVEQAAARASAGDTAAFRADALGLFERAAAAAQPGGDPQAGAAAFRELGDLLRSGHAAERAGVLLFERADRTAGRATELRRVRIIEARAYSEAQVVVLLGGLLELVREHANVQTALAVADAFIRRYPGAAGGIAPPALSG